MKKTNNTTLITVGQLAKELKRFEKKHWDWIVEISTDEPVGEDEGLPCIIVGMGLDEDGDLRIEIEDEWAGGGDYNVGELLEQLRGFDSSARVYLAGGGLLFSIDSQGGIFADADDDDDALSCSATAFGEYKVEPTGRKVSEAEEQEQAEHTRKKARKDRLGFIATVVMAVALFSGLCYNVYALVTHSTQYAVWEHVLWIVLCVFLLFICGGMLYYSKEK